MKYLHSILVLLVFGLQATAFDESDLKEGRVIEIDLPGGCTVLAPAYFEVKETETPNSVSFQDPEGYIYGGANLLPNEFMEFDEFAQTFHSGLKDSLPDTTELGEIKSKYFTLGDTQNASLYYLPVKNPKMGFFHLLADLEQGVLHVSVNVTGQYEGKNQGLETLFSRDILLSLKTSEGLKLKPASHSRTTQQPANHR